MEKMVNMQAMSALRMQTQPSVAQQTQPKDDFMKLLNQKKDVTAAEAATQPQTALKAERPRDTEAADAAEAKKTAQETPEEPQDAAEAAREGMQQLAMEQAAAQLAGIVTEAPEQTLPEVTQAVTEAAAVTVDVAVSAQSAAAEGTEAIPAQAQPHKAEAQAAQKEEGDPAQGASGVQAEATDASGKPSSEAGRPTQEEGNAASAQTERASVKTAQEGVKAQGAENAYAALQQAASAPTQSVAWTAEAAKTGQNTTVTATVEEVPAQIADNLFSRQAGERTLTIELEPASLGKLTIRLEYEAGRTAVSIAASNPKTLELLNERAPELAQILKARTGEETVIYTQEPQREPSEAYDGRQGGRGREEQREGHTQEQGKEQQAESFAQQLRLGLV